MGGIRYICPYVLASRSWHRHHICEILVLLPTLSLSILLPYIRNCINESSMYTPKENVKITNNWILIMRNWRLKNRRMKNRRLGNRIGSSTNGSRRDEIQVEVTARRAIIRERMATRYNKRHNVEIFEAGDIISVIITLLSNYCEAASRTAIKMWHSNRPLFHKSIATSMIFLSPTPRILSVKRKLP